MLACRTCWPTFSLHTHGQALLVAAVLAPVPLALVDQAVLVVAAGVGQVLAHRPLEEALATLTAVHPIVLACGAGVGEWSLIPYSAGWQAREQEGPPEFRLALALSSLLTRGQQPSWLHLLGLQVPDLKTSVPSKWPALCLSYCTLEEGGHHSSPSGCWGLVMILGHSCMAQAQAIQEAALAASQLSTVASSLEASRPPCPL
jgi:hypothetical protein